MAHRSGRSDFEDAEWDSGSDSPAEWPPLDPADWALVSGSAAAGPVASAPARAASQEPCSLEDTGSDSEVDSVGESDGGTSAWSFANGSAASVTSALLIEALGERLETPRGPRPGTPSSVRNGPQEDALSRSSSGLFVDVSRTPSKLLHSFDIGTPLSVEPADSWDGSWEAVDCPRLPMVFDISTLPQAEGQPQTAREEHVTAESFDISGPQGGPVDHERRLLFDVLWASQPTWGPGDLVAAERKLAKLGIDSIASLVVALRLDFNQALRKADRADKGTDEARPRLLKDTLGTASGRCMWPARQLRAPALSYSVFSPKKRRISRLLKPALLPCSGSPTAQERLLCDTLWKSRPTWTPSDLAAAERKLAQVGVRDLASLDGALAGGGLNYRLRRADLKTFSAETVAALRRQVNAAFGRTELEEDKQDAWMNSTRYDPESIRNTSPVEPGLRDVLWESRPTWSALDLASAERKLALVGITSVGGLAGALSGNINEQLRTAGVKTFNHGTIRELRRRLGVAPPPRRGLQKSHLMGE